MQRMLGKLQSKTNFLTNSKIKVNENNKSFLRGTKDVGNSTNGHKEQIPLKFRQSIFIILKNDEFLFMQLREIQRTRNSQHKLAAFLDYQCHSY